MKSLSVPTTTHGRVLIEDAAGSSLGLVVGFHGYGENADVMMRHLTRIPGLDGWTKVSVQALHRFYTANHSRVGASWMTKQDREAAIVDNVAYVDTVVDEVVRHQEAETGSAGSSPVPLMVVGFSQGAAMAYRAVLLGRHPAAGVVAVGGDIPPEIRDDAAAQTWPPALIAAGSRDDWYDQAKLDIDLAFLRRREVTLELLRYDGAHEWTDEVRAGIGAWINRTMG